MGGLDCQHLISHIRLVEYGSPFMNWCAVSFSCLFICLDADDLCIFYAMCVHAGGYIVSDGNLIKGWMLYFSHCDRGQQGCTSASIMHIHIV